MRKHADRDHAGPLAHFGFEGERIADPQPRHVDDVLTVVRHERQAVFFPHLRNAAHGLELAHHAAQSRRFVCIADASKLVDTLGAFPLPVEVIPMAARRVMRQFEAMGGIAQVREKDGLPLVTDNGQHIVDVTGLRISDPLAFESEVSQWPGVVTVGVFAHQKADVCLLGTPSGVQTLQFD